MLEAVPYPARVQHMADEPSYGLLVRTAAHNGVIRPAKTFRTFSPSGTGPATVSVEAVAAACKADLVSLKWATPILSRSKAIVMDEVFDRKHFSAETKRWCPECLRQHAYHRVWWDLVPVTTCPFHGVDLMTRCGCQIPLITVVNFIDHCRKGHSLANLEAPKANEDSLAVDRYIIQRLFGAKQQGHPHLDDSTLEDVIQLATKIGRAVLAPAHSLHKSQKDEIRRHFLAYGFAALTDLNGKLADTLNLLCSKEGSPIRKWGLERTYGRFYSDLMQSNDSPLRTAIHDIFTRHVGSTKVILKGGSISDRYGKSEETVLISEAAKMCGLSTDRFRRLAVEFDVVPDEWGRGTPLRIERHKAEDLAVRLKGHKTLTEISRELGLSKKAAGGIVRSGLIEIIMTGASGQEGFNHWVIHRDGAVNLLARLDALVPSELEAGDHLASLPLAAKFCSTVLETVNDVLEGRLKIRGMDMAAIGLCRYLLSRSEVRISAQRERAPGFTVNQTADEIGLGKNAVISFANGHLLKTTRYGAIRTVSQDEIERFKCEYATVPQLAQLLDLREGMVKSVLTQAGVKPVAEPPKFAQILYERPKAMEALLASRK